LGEAGKRAAAIAAAAAVTLAAACGGSSRLSKTEYERKMNAVVIELESACNLNLRASVGLERRVLQLDDAQKKFNNSANEIDNLQPPKVVEADNRNLADALRVLAHRFGEIKKAVESRNEENVGSALQTRSDYWAVALEDLLTKGYSVSPFSCSFKTGD